MTRTVKLIFLGCLLAVSIVMSSIAVERIVTAGETTVSNLSEIRETDEYLIKSYNGYIAVYYDSKGYPAWISDMPVGSLREYDRKLLKNGITVESREALLQILEDLES